jgi:hypothetical protein
MKLLIDGLYATGNMQYYVNMTYIAYKLWGWEIPELEPSLRNKMIEDYKIISTMEDVE